MLTKRRWSPVGLEQLPGEARVLAIDVLDQLAQGRPVGGDAAFAADGRAEHGRDAYVGHASQPSVVTGAPQNAS